MLEYETMMAGCVLTLTYGIDPIVLHRSHYQKFLKKLRKAIYPQKIKYFGCGEYGKFNKRPHYHMIILGYTPHDCLPTDVPNFFVSPFINKIWKHGNVIIDKNITREAVVYSSLYASKGASDSKICPITGNSHPEFLFMSRGIGDLAIKNQLENYKLTGKLHLPGGKETYSQRAEVLLKKIYDEEIITEPYIDKDGNYKETRIIPWSKYLSYHNRDGRYVISEIDGEYYVTDFDPTVHNAQKYAQESYKYSKMHIDKSRKM